MEVWHRSIWRTPDRELRARLRRLEVGRSQDAECNALVGKYVGIVALSGDTASVSKRGIFGGPPLRTPVTSFRIAQVGATARLMRRAGAAARDALPPPRQLVGVACQLLLRSGKPKPPRVAIRYEFGSCVEPSMFST